jgi:hypothetical protein
LLPILIGITTLAIAQQKRRFSRAKWPETKWIFQTQFSEWKISLMQKNPAMSGNIAGVMQQKKAWGGPFFITRTHRAWGKRSTGRTVWDRSLS